MIAIPLNAQDRESEPKIKQDIMAQFDVKKFRENNHYNSDRTYVLKNGDKIRYFYNPNVDLACVFVGNTTTDTPYNYYQEFDEKGNLRRQLKQFYSIEIGKETFWDSTGRIVKEIDHDIPFEFTLDSLIKKIKKEYHVDLMQKNRNTQACRFQMKNDTILIAYELAFPDYRDPNLRHYVLIDGITGEALYSKEYPYRYGEYHSPSDEYIKTLKNATLGSGGGNTSENSGKKK